MLAWLCVWVKVQIWIWPSWCHRHSLSLAPVLVPDKIQEGCKMVVCVCVCVCVCVFAVCACTDHSNSMIYASRWWLETNHNQLSPVSRHSGPHNSWLMSDQALISYEIKGKEWDHQRGWYPCCTNGHAQPCCWVLNASAICTVYSLLHKKWMSPWI